MAADFRAYSKGVNAYIGQALLNPLKLPAEYPALQVLPKPRPGRRGVGRGGRRHRRLAGGGRHAPAARGDGPHATGRARPPPADHAHRLVVWAEGESRRRDANGDGAYEDPFGPALMDAWWEPAVAAIFDPASGHAFDHLGLEVHDGPQHHVGSAFQSGAYSHVNKDLRQVLGEPVQSRFSQTYCGGGVLSACRLALWRALGAAARRLEGEFGSASVSSWQRHPADDQIEFSAVGLTNIPPMRWVNRPTFQQVVQVGAR